MRNGTLDPSSFSIAFFEFNRSFPLPSALQEFILLFWFKTQGARSFSRAGTPGSGGTSLTTGFAKADVNAGLASLILTVGPNLAHLTSGTGDPLLIPINPKASHIIALVRLGLPGGVDPDRSDKLHPILLLALTQGRGIHVTPVQQMFLRQKVLGLQSLMDRVQDLFILGRGWRGFDMGTIRQADDQVWIAPATDVNNFNLLTP